MSFIENEKPFKKTTTLVEASTKPRHVGVIKKVYEMNWQQFLLKPKLDYITHPKLQNLKFLDEPFWSSYLDSIANSAIIGAKNRALLIGPPKGLVKNFFLI